MVVVAVQELERLQQEHLEQVVQPLLRELLEAHSLPQDQIDLMGQLVEMEVLVMALLLPVR
jgi:hypothetical protein